MSKKKKLTSEECFKIADELIDKFPLSAAKLVDEGIKKKHRETFRKLKKVLFGINGEKSKEAKSGQKK